MSKKIKEDIISMVCEGVHTSLRKHCDSKESLETWKAIRDLPDEEWNGCGLFVAGMLLDIFDIKEKDASSDEKNVNREQVYKDLYWQLTLSMRGYRDEPDRDSNKRYVRLRKIRKLLFEEMTEQGFKIPGPPHRL